MDSPVSIADSVFWVGANDRQTDLFEGIWPLPRGVSYNSYLIIDKKTALFDTVKEASLPTLLDHIKSSLGTAGKIDYLIIHHLEPDHSGSVPFLRQIFPDMEIIGNEKTALFLEHLYGIKTGVRIIKDGDELDLGKRKLKFYMTPMVHWPETMMTYESEDKILFSGDAFGSFGTLDGDIFDDKLDIAYYEDEILRYFSNIVGKYTSPVLKAIDKLSGINVAIVAPTHGPVWRKSPGEIIERYARFSRQDSQQGVVVAFGSMYGSTEQMAEAVMAGVRKGGICNLIVHDVSRSHVSYILRDAWRYRGLILGAPTYDAAIFPQMNSLVHLLEEKKLSRRIAGVFGSYGWSGGCVKGLRQFVENTKQQLIEPVVEARFSATAEQTELCEQLGQNVAQAVLNSR